MGVVIAFVGLDGKTGIVCSMFCILADDMLVNVDDCLHII